MSITRLILLAHSLNSLNNAASYWETAAFYTSLDPINTVSPSAHTAIIQLLYSQRSAVR
jgi:hypothetical protein